MIGLAETLRSIAEKELAGEELTEEERYTIQEYGHYLETLGQFTDSEEGRTLSPAAEKSAVGGRRTHQLPSRNRRWRRRPAIP